VDISIFDEKREMAVRAATDGADALRSALERDGRAAIALATAASQNDMLACLVEQPDIDWSKVTGFHLAEYIGLPASHPASYRHYAKRWFVDKLPGLSAFHYVDGEAPDPAAEAVRLDVVVKEHPLAVGFIGIGENGHLAFNDPPADFETEKPYLVVDLDEASRRQQLGERCFPTLDDVPRRALSMSIQRILSATTLIVTVPGERKAKAVVAAVEGPLTNQCPASILRSHADCRLFLDRDSASRLNAHS
jgi:glucosamine-6-phosphate deaminase